MSHANSITSNRLINLVFKDVTQIKHDFVLVPSKGDFLTTFDNQTGLHIAIVTGEDDILEFSQKGLGKCNPDETRWRQCLPLNFCQRLAESNIHKTPLNYEELYGAWRSASQIIKLHQNNPKWTTCNYHTDTNNCFDFALEFMNIFLEQLSDRHQFSNIVSQYVNLTKISFCELFVVPLTRQAAVVITLHRKQLSNHNHEKE